MKYEYREGYIYQDGEPIADLACNPDISKDEMDQIGAAMAEAMEAKSNE